MTRLSPRSEALAYRIWAFCKDQEWNCTPGQIGEALGETAQRVGQIVYRKGWQSRLSGTSTLRHGADRWNSTGGLEMLDGLSVRDAIRAAGVPERGARLE